jgi:hypothetical protein
MRTSCSSASVVDQRGLELEREVLERVSPPVSRGRMRNIERATSWAGRGPPGSRRGRGVELEKTSRRVSQSFARIELFVVGS